VRSSKLRRLLAVFFALTLLTAACGRGDDDDDTGASGQNQNGGAPSETAGFDGQTIKVGVITPTTGLAAVIGNPLTNGNRVYFDRVNDAGGIGGKYPVEMVVEDNAYTTDKTVEKYNKIKNDVVMFAQILGTPPTNAVLQQLKRDNIVAAPASLDAEWLGEQNLLPVGGPYQTQAINAMTYALEDGGQEGKTVCVVYQDDPYGEAGVEGVDFAGDQLDFEVAKKVPFSAGNQDWTAQIQQLQSSNCELVFLVATPSDAGRALGAAATARYAPRWIGQSPTWISAFAQGALAPYLQANFWLASEGPEWGDQSVPGMRQMLADIQQFSAQQAPDGYFTFGYAQAWAVTQVLEAAVEKGDLSRDGIVEAMNSLNEIKVGGLFGDYEWGPPEDRNPPRTSTVFRVDPNAPVGLKAQSKVNFTSDGAGEYNFEG
jgi:ABC-type branched-subunit amino acid transport system substrate-binding protein